MDALNTLRAVLVGCAFIASLLLVTRGLWAPAAVLGLGIAAHLALFLYQRTKRRQDDAAMTALGGYPASEA